MADIRSEHNVSNDQVALKVAEAKELGAVSVQVVPDGADTSTVISIFPNSSSTPTADGNNAAAAAHAAAASAHASAATAHAAAAGALHAKPSG